MFFFANIVRFLASRFTTAYSTATWRMDVILHRNSYTVWQKMPVGVRTKAYGAATWRIALKYLARL